MKKLLSGIVEFRNNVQPDYREKFAKLALGQSPDALFIACSDSRVVPNLFASTDPGDLFVIRNVGNLIPTCGHDGHSLADESEAAAIEFAIMNLNVSNIIVCGHSECGAMNAVIAGRENVSAPNLRSWLRHGEEAQFRTSPMPSTWSPTNHLSQQNVLQQLDHLRTYQVVLEREQKNLVQLHGWWFDIKTANVYAYEKAENQFLLIDEAEAKRISQRL